jgi:hypothetical protein
MDRLVTHFGGSRSLKVPIPTAFVVGLSILVCAACGNKDLTRTQAQTMLEQEWREQPLSATFGSPTGLLICGCGVEKKLWNYRFDTTPAFAIQKRYYLTPEGRTHFVDVKFSEINSTDMRSLLANLEQVTAIVFRGPYIFEVTGIAQGNKPTSRKVEVSWKIDWSNVRSEVKSCFADMGIRPSGQVAATFELYDDGWRIVP